MRKSSGFHNLLLFLLFVIIASLFWVIMTMNDSAQVNLEVNLRISGKPDSLTFINEPPAKIHVTIRDKGTSLLRSAFARNPVVSFNFKEFASDGVFRLKASDIYSALRARFSQTVQLSSLSVDSIRLIYTDLPPKTVPVEIESDLTASLGYVVDRHLIPSRKFVKVYSVNPTLLDTLQRVRTQVIRRSNLSQSVIFKIGFQPLPGARIDPERITVTVPVEPLVSKQVKLEVNAVNVPPGENISLFPAMVNVDVFVPMSRFSEPLEDLTAIVDYDDIAKGGTGKKLEVRISKAPKYVVDPKVSPRTVEYILVK